MGKNEELVGLERENTSLRRTLKYISHELLNVLTLVDYSIKAVDGSVNQVRDSRDWQYIIEDVDYMVNIMKDLSRYNHCGELKKEECCVSEWIEYIVGEIKGKYRDKADVVACAEGCRELFVAQIDKNKIRQAIINLIKNAVEAIGEQENGVIIVFVKREVKWINIEIADNGCGIAAEDIDNIFEEGVSLNKKNGSGLGLAITRKIIETHNGTISVTSARGEGTIFNIRLPVQ